MAAIAAVAGVIGSVVGAVGSIAAANNQAAALDAQAQERERVAQEERAAATRRAAEKQREEKFALSTLRARAASSGSGAQDPTVTRLAGRLSQEANYQTRGIVYEGESRASTLEAQAGIDRMQARAARQAGFFQGASTLLGGFSSLASFAGNRAGDSIRPRSGYYY